MRSAYGQKSRMDHAQREKAVKRGELACMVEYTTLKEAIRKAGL